MDFIAYVIKKIILYKDFFIVLTSLISAIILVFNFIFMRKLERYKTELQKRLKENEVKFSKIYYEKATVIKELYSKSSDIQGIFETFLISDSDKKPQLKSKIAYSDINKTKKLVEDFNSYFDKNRIFLSEQLEAMLNEVTISCKEFADFINNTNKDDVNTNNLNQKFFNAFVTDFPKIRDELKSEFKNFLELDY